MKKFISLIAAASLFAAVSGAAIAADNNPAVYVNNAKIFFADQEAVIVDGRTLVPARGVFEAMGAKVEWDGETRQVEVTSADENTIVRLVIDDADMKVYDMSGLFATLLAGQDFKAPETVVTLDVPAQIMNDRTMVPLRAISEAFDSEVEWNAEEYLVDITTKDAPTAEQSETMPTYFLTTSADKVEEGETVDVYVNVKNLPADTYVSGITAVVKFDAENFEFVSSEMVNGDVKIEDAVGIDNDTLGNGEIKINYSTIVKETAAQTDCQIAKLTFKSTNGKDGLFVIENGYRPTKGFDTALLTANLDEAEAFRLYDGNKLNIDFTPVIVNAAE